MEQNLGALPKEASADAGYSSYENLEYVQHKGLDAYMPDDFFEALEREEQARRGITRATSGTTRRGMSISVLRVGT